MNCIRVGLILLAAGESKRMGTPKQLIEYNRRSLIRHTVEVAIASDCHPIIVVLGANRDRIIPEISNLPVNICHNRQWQKGMSSSIAVGIEALAKSEIDAVIVALADQPLINTNVYNQLVKHYQTSKQPAIASAYNHTLGVPALFDRTLFAELIDLQGQGGAKKLLKRYSQPKFNLAVPEAAIDLDTPEDLQHLRSLERNIIK
ncbi:NTP transferase domain-containing protein [Myxosarcina sp. GI1]|uniref:nucleotidyltransferase family protein n=1 Tax=Myxosarcina sp. GI1 TaxID=1541065 RepID=UPI00055BBFAE|nr:nucleotidyltransferase family protein [Myxosarcina sp. GI1]